MSPTHEHNLITGEQLARQIADLMDDKNGQGIVALDVRGLANFADYFLVCTGRSDRQAKAIHDAIREGMKQEFDMLPVHTEGESERRWILLDYGDVIAHVMIPEVREYYRIEQLWSDAPQLDLDLTPAADAADSAA